MPSHKEAQERWILDNDCDDDNEDDADDADEKKVHAILIAER